MECLASRGTRDPSNSSRRPSRRRCKATVGCGAARRFCSGSRKRPLNEAEDAVDECWFFNWARVSRILRDELILDGLKANDQLDPADAYIWAGLLQVADQNSTVETAQSDPVSVQEICRWLTHETGKPHGVEDVDRKLAAVADASDAPFRRLGDSGGGLYTVGESAYTRDSLQNTPKPSSSSATTKWRASSWRLWMSAPSECSVWCGSTAT